MTDQELLHTIEQAVREGWEELDLSDQQLTILPPEIGQLTQLKVLARGNQKWWKRVDGNPLRFPPPEIVERRKTLSEALLSGSRPLASDYRRRLI